MQLTQIAPVRLRFTAMADQSYFIEYRDSLTAGAWTWFATVPAGAAARVVELQDNGVNGSRFYRVRTP